MAAKHREVTGPLCPYHGKEMGLANGGLHCPIPGCSERVEVGPATTNPDHGYRSLRELQAELKEEDVNPDAKNANREPNLGPDGEPVLEEVGARQSEENAHGVPRITEGPDGKIETGEKEHHKKHRR